MLCKHVELNIGTRLWTMHHRKWFLLWFLLMVEDTWERNLVFLSCMKLRLTHTVIYRSHEVSSHKICTGSESVSDRIVAFHLQFTGSLTSKGRRFVNCAKCCLILNKKKVISMNLEWNLVTGIIYLIGKGMSYSVNIWLVPNAWD